MELIDHGEWKLYYKKTGLSGDPLLLFHGFGQTHSWFNPLINVLKEKYICFSFDLFFHGESTAPKDQELDQHTWNILFEKFIKKEGINTFSLGGFSLGGKYALAIYFNNPGRVNELFFLAPDGIKTNIWYKLATSPYLFRRLFKSTIRHPQRFFFLTRFLRRFKVINKSVLRFVETQMKTPSQRMKVYQTWVGMRKIQFKSRHIKNTIKKYNTPTTIFIGKHDKIIPARTFINFSKSVPSCELKILDCGHNDLINAVAVCFSGK